MVIPVSSISSREFIAAFSPRALMTTKLTDAPPSIKNSPVPDSSSGTLMLMRGAGASLMRVPLRSGLSFGELLCFRSSFRLYVERDRSLKTCLIRQTNLANLVDISDYAVVSYRIFRHVQLYRNANNINSACDLYRNFLKWNIVFLHHLRTVSRSDKKGTSRGSGDARSRPSCVSVLLVPLQNQMFL